MCIPVCVSAYMCVYLFSWCCHSTNCSVLTDIMIIITIIMNVLTVCCLPVITYRDLELSPTKTSQQKLKLSNVIYIFIQFLRVEKKNFNWTRVIWNFNPKKKDYDYSYCLYTEGQKSLLKYLDMYEQEVILLTFIFFLFNEIFTEKTM